MKRWQVVMMLISITIVCAWLSSVLPSWLGGTFNVIGSLIFFGLVIYGILWFIRRFFSDANKALGEIGSALYQNVDRDRQTEVGRSVYLSATHAGECLKCGEDTLVMTKNKKLLCVSCEFEVKR